MIAESGDTPIHYESGGTGEAVLLVMGLGVSAAGWWRTVPVLAKRFRVLAFDHRGIGRSGKPRGPYTVAQMVDDALAVLDAAGEKRAHVYGHALGGMVAQELALRAPERVRSLVLGSTTAGGEDHELPDRETLAFLQRRAEIPAEEAAWASVPYSYCTATIEHAAERVAEDVEQRLRFPAEPDGYEAQLAAAWQHDTSSRARQIGAPALVLHGSDDRIVPVANGRRLAERLANARLHELAGAGYLYTTDVPEADDVVLRFLAAT